MALDLSTFPQDLDAKALSAGVDPFEDTRATLIEWRDAALSAGTFDPRASVFLAHVIWWMSTLAEEACRDRLG